MKSFKSIQKYLGKMAEKNPESIYGKAAKVAAYQLGDLTKPVAEPLVYVRATKKESR